MFLRYPRSVRMKINRNLCIVGRCVIKEDKDGNLLYSVKDTLDVEDIEHKTELYTQYGKCKILNMNDKWYLYIMPSCTIIKKYKDRRYREGFCEFISNERSEEELLKLYSERLSNMEKEYMEYRIDRLNQRVSKYLADVNESLKIVHALIDYDRSYSEIKYSYLTDNNMVELKKIVELVEELKQVSQNPY